ncbi:hypothetical protein [Sphingobacterium sp. ML3W]|uniref:hypothetical protein n=1 Tax=Sphingobacterium sp. ML3W TaxID=1538644 RepID=UPI00068B9F6C|nr:hypothetical protein [Sphingobacterium sp. ML3W]
MTHSQLVDIAHSLVLRKFSCGVAFKEMMTGATSEIPDVIGFGGGGHSVLIECKVSRSDYKRNALKQHNSPMGKYRFFCVPEGLVKIEEVPRGWGLIQVNEKGKLLNIYNPFDTYIGGPASIPKEERHSFNIVCPSVERNFMYSALRRIKKG